MVSSERAEQSSARVRRALAHYRTQVADRGDAIRVVAGRRPSRGGWYQTFHAQDAILRIVSIAEDFSIGRFVDAIEPTLPPHGIVTELWDAQLDRASDTWQQRDELWKTYKNVNVATFPQMQVLQGFIVARNAVAHGLGQLTRKQLRKRASTVGRLGQADIRVRGDVLDLGAADVERCAGAVLAFIAWLDDKG
jgi:hypothetical protein